MERLNKFKIVIPSYNNQEWVEPNMASIINQTYSNYEVLYINDASTDDTLHTVKHIIREYDLSSKWTIVTNETNQKRGYNVSPLNKNIIDFMDSDEDILVFVDGDDWLVDDKVLENLNSYYNKHQSWMTYGGMYCYPSGDIANPQNTPYSNEVHAHNLYRKDHWRASHLRSFKWHLYKRIEKEHMLYSETGKYYFPAEDLATSFPCLEMCPQHKIGVVDFPTYMFNATPSNRERGVQREADAGEALESEIRHQKPYKTLSTLTTALYSHNVNNGLGNLLFTLASGYAASKTYGRELYSTKPNGYSEYKDNILRNIRLTDKTPNNSYVEESFSYNKIPNVDAIEGYFQSEKYFKEYRKEILNLFSISDNTKEYIDSKYKKLLDGNTCSIHVRRGDYVKLQEKHPLMDLSYFDKATSEIVKKHSDIRFVVFSDDINWCKEAFKNKNFTFIEDEKDYIDLHMMSLCKHNIIVNSTFSWWGAWLNTNPNKIVIAPKVWFGSSSHEDSKDVIPNDWTVL